MHVPSDNRKFNNYPTNWSGEQSPSSTASKQPNSHDELFKSLIGNIPGVVYRCVCDANRTIEFISDRIEEIAGYPASDFIQNRVRSFESIVHPEDRAISKQTIDRAASANSPYILEYRIARADGNFCWVREQGQGIFNSQGQLCWRDGIIFEMSEMYPAKAAEQKSQEPFKLLVESINDSAIMMLDPAGEVVTWNSGAECIQGYQESDIIGKHFSCFYPPDETKQGVPKQKLDDCLARGRIEEEGWRIRKDGSRFWANAIVSALRDSQGNLLGFSQVIRDKTNQKKAEDALEEAHRQNVELLTNISDGFLKLDTQGKLTNINSQAERLLKNNRQPLLGQNLWENFSDDIDSFFPQLEEAIARQAPVRFESYYAPSERWLEVRAYPNQKGISVFLKDLTEGKQNIDNLPHGEELYRTLVKNFPNGAVFLFDRDMRYTLVEGNDLKASGLSKKLLEGKTVCEAWSAENCETLEPLYRAALAGEATVSEMVDGDRIYSLQILPVKNHSGEVFTGMMIAQNITERKQAEAENAQLIASLQKSEAQTRSMASLLAEAQKLAHVGCWEFDVVTQQLTWSDEIFRIFGLEPTEQFPTYSEYLQKIHPEDVERSQQLIDRALQEGKAYEFEQRILRPDGSIRYLSANGEPIFNEEGQVIKLLGSILDITERELADKALRQSEAQLEQRAKELEEALYKLQSTQSQLIQTERMSGLGQTVAGIAHQINNPVSFIYGNIVHANSYIQDLVHVLNLYQNYYPDPVPEISEEIEAIDLEFLFEDLPKLLRSMKVGAERIREIVRSLRNFSRLDEAEIKSVDIHEGINSTLLILQHRLTGNTGSNNLDRSPIEVIKEYGDLPMVDCYPSQLNQVFLNLLNNAIDALETHSAGGMGNRDEKHSSAIDEQAPLPHSQSPTIRICTEAIDEYSIAIRITDNGCGITEQVQQRMFDPFFTTKPIGTGTGLGLSISYQIVVEKHKGQLTCISEPGKGTELIIQLPVRQNYPEPALFE